MAGPRLRRLRRSLVVPASLLLLVGCAADPDVSQRIADAVAALPQPDGWVEQGGIRRACDVVNLDCADTSSGVLLVRAGAPEEVCDSVIPWVLTTGALVGPRASGSDGSSSSPDQPGCVEEARSRARYLVRAGSEVTSAGTPATWSILLVETGHERWRLDVVLGAPPSLTVPG